MVHLFEIMFISYIRQFLICLFGLQIGAGGFLLHFDLLLPCFFYPFLLELNTSICYLKLFELFLFCNDELMDGIILQSESPKCIRDLFLFFITGFLNYYESQE